MGSLPLTGFRSIRGHAGPLELLRRAMDHDRVASAYLFTGPAGVGKDRVAHALAQVMNCTARSLPGTPRDACGECTPCHRIAAGMHPDVIVLQRELKEPPKDTDPRAAEIRATRREEIPESELRQVITIEQVRELIARMPFRPHEGGTRWVIVREAERFQPASANAFLKTLEEPPEATHFVLLTHNPSMLLTTIRSRCQVVRFGPLDTPDVAAVLRDLGTDASAADTAAPLADGSVGRALEFADAEALASRRAFVDRLLAALNAGRGGGYVELGDEAKGLDKRDLEAVLSLFQRHFRQEAIARAGQNPRHAAVFATRADIVREAQESLESSTNLNVQFTVQSMLVRLREARP